MKGISESLAGRVAVIYLLGMSRRELTGRGETVRPFLPLMTELDVSPDHLNLHTLYHMI